MMMVSGPGQNAAISSWARSGTSLTRPGSIVRAGDMDDQGVVLRAALGHKDLCDRRAVARIGGNAVDRLGGQGHQLPSAQQISRFGDCFALSR